MKKRQEEKTLFTKALITEKSDTEFTAVASTTVEDRQGEVIDQKGWDLENFKNNPVLLWAHDHSIPAIGKATDIAVRNGKLVFKGVWQDITDMGKAAKQLVDEGFINSFSVGFLPSEMDGNTYTKQELLEISLVNVPANPQAMMLAMKSLKDSNYKKNVIKGIFNAMVKGAVQDELDAEAEMEAKWNNMDSVFDIFYAFCDVYFSQDTPSDQFKSLLQECIDILGQVVDGSYVDPDEQKSVKVVDKESKLEKDVDELKIKVETLAKEQKSSASNAPEHKARQRQTLIKAIAKSSDLILVDQKLGVKSNRQERLAKIIKRASDKLAESHKETL